jgi:pimeloyl-ACP methyl ester carboxylesterase
MSEASVNGIRLFYEERGSGTPILGIHGAGSTARFWEDAATRLSELGRAIVYDRRGCSRSELPDAYEATSVQEHADDARELLRALDAEPAVLIGRSYGGTIALDLAIRHPDSVLGIALLEAGPVGLDPIYDAWFEGVRASAEGAPSPDRVGEAVMREVFGTWDGLPAPFREVFTANGQALLAEVRGTESTDLARLVDLDVPALVVTAAASPEPIRRGSEALGRAIPGARSVHVGGDHAIDPAGPAVVEFVTGLTRS